MRVPGLLVPAYAVPPAAHTPYTLRAKCTIPKHACAQNACMDVRECVLRQRRACHLARCARLKPSFDVYALVPVSIVIGEGHGVAHDFISTGQRNELGQEQPGQST